MSEQEIPGPAELECPRKGCTAVATDDVILYGTVLFKACPEDAAAINADQGRGWALERDPAPMAGGQPVWSVYRIEPGYRLIRLERGALDLGLG